MSPFADLERERGETPGRKNKTAKANEKAHKRNCLKAVLTPLQTPRKNALSHTPSPRRALAPGRAMEGQAGTASAPAPPRRSTRCHCVMRSGFSLSYEDEGGGASECHG